MTRPVPAFIVLFWFCLLTCPLVCSAGEPFRLYPWKIIQTRFTRVKYHSSQDLDQFHAAVNYGPAHWNVSPHATGLSSEQYHDIIRKKVDLVFSKAAEILDMHKAFEPVNINLYTDKDALASAYKGIYSGQCRIRAWYRFKNNTIYLNVKDVHVGMLAHEMAHAIIDHYLTVRPPAQSAEILARYVDSHIHRGFAQ